MRNIMLTLSCLLYTSVTVEQTEPGKKPSSTDATIGAKAQEDKKTSVDETGKKPVKPTDEDVYKRQI